MTVMEDVRATIPGLREGVADLREALPDLRTSLPELRESIPDARAALPALRESLADLRAELPGPWRRERPSLVRRIALVVVIGLAVTATAWVVMAFVERRRLRARSEPTAEDRTALARAEDEGMGAAIGASSTSQAKPLPTGQSPTIPAVGTRTTPAVGTPTTTAVGAVSDPIPPLVGTRSSSFEGGQSDGR
jgi:hypothetical protein